jgi:hypothetical protein
MLRTTHGRFLVGLVILTIAVATISILVTKPWVAIAQMPPPMEEVPPPDMMTNSDDRDTDQQPQHEPVWRVETPYHQNQAPTNQPRVIPPISRITYGGSPAIAASGEYVYVVQGNTLYQFSARTLKLVNKAELAPTPLKPGFEPQQNSK